MCLSRWYLDKVKDKRNCAKTHKEFSQRMTFLWRANWKVIRYDSLDYLFDFYWIDNRRWIYFHFISTVEIIILLKPFRKQKRSFLGCKYVRTQKSTLILFLLMISRNNSLHSWIGKISAKTYLSPFYPLQPPNSLPCLQFK